MWSTAPLLYIYLSAKTFIIYYSYGAVGTKLMLHKNDWFKQLLYTFDCWRRKKKKEKKRKRKTLEIIRRNCIILKTKLDTLIVSV